MTRRLPGDSALAASISEALRLISDYADPPGHVALLAPEPLPNLLAQCEALCADADVAGSATVRTVHHFACTGGTLMSKCVAALPNTVLLSEIDPLSPLPRASGTPSFAPTDLIGHLRGGLRPVDDADTVAIFQETLRSILRRLDRRGQRLVLRDHAHSQFCTDSDDATRPSLREMIAAIAPVRSVVTVRHPLDSFLSLRAAGWVHFSPPTIDEYARRYLRFLDRHAGLPLFRYEAFVAAPEQTVQDIATALHLPYSAGVGDLLPAIALTGDSGRSGSLDIALRPRRDVPPDVAEDAAGSKAYQTLLSTLGY